jgi:phage portal protein BeeE
MPTPPRLRSHAPVATRARYARTSGDMMVGGFNPAAGIDPSGQPPVWWMGLDSGGLSYPIGPHGPWEHGYADGLPVVTRATSLITGPLTAAPFKVQETTAGTDPMARPKWVTDPCLVRPDERFPVTILPAAVKLTRGAFWSSWIRDACHFGTGAFLCQEDTSGQPLAGSLKIVCPALLSTERGADGSLRWVIGSDGAGPDDRVVFDRDGYVTLGPVTYRIITLRNPHATTDLEGHTPGVFEAHPSAFRLAGQIETYTSGTFRSGIPAGYLKVDQTMSGMTETQADELKAKWMDNHGGDRRSIAVLNAFTSFVPLNLSPVDAALGDVTRLSIASVAMAFALDPEVLGTSLSNSATYKNAQEYWSRHRDFGLSPWIAAVQDTLSALLPGTLGVLVDLDRFSNPEPMTRFQGYQVAIASGVLTVGECRELEGLPPLPAADPVPAPLAAVEDPPVPPGSEFAPSPTSVRAIRPQPWR